MSIEVRVQISWTATPTDPELLAFCPAVYPTLREFWPFQTCNEYFAHLALGHLRTNECQQCLTAADSHHIVPYCTIFYRYVSTPNDIRKI